MAFFQRFSASVAAHLTVFRLRFCPCVTLYCVESVWSRNSVGIRCISLAEVVARRAVDPFVYVEPLGRELARQPRLPAFLFTCRCNGHKMAHVSKFVWKRALVEPASETAKTLYKTTVFPIVWQT